MCASFTVSSAAESGALNVHRGTDGPDALPVVSYTVLPAAVCANGQPFPITAVAGAVVALDSADKLWLSVTAAAHVRVIVTGAIIADPSAIVEPPQPDNALSDIQKRLALQRQAVREMTAALTPPK